jgi:hypothetical protein
MAGFGDEVRVTIGGDGFGGPGFSPAVTTCSLSALAAEADWLPDQKVRAVAQACAHQRSHYYVANEVHSQDDTRYRDAYRQG